jgi:hypothetical protein
MDGGMYHAREMRNEYKILNEKHESKIPHKDAFVDRRVILKLILENRVGRCGLDLSSS